MRNDEWKMETDLRRSHDRFRPAALLLVLCLWIISVEPAAAQPTARLSARDHAFLEDLSRRAFRYFQDHADPQTGLVLDRARTGGAAHDAGHPSHNIASSAATGFGLTALCIAAERGWIPRREARERVRKTLRFFA